MLLFIVHMSPEIHNEVNWTEPIFDNKIANNFP